MEISIQSKFILLLSKLIVENVKRLSVLLIMILLVKSAKAQNFDCTNYIFNYTDAITGEQYIKTITPIILHQELNRRIILSIKKEKKITTFWFGLIDYVVCINENALIYLVMEDDSRVKLESNSSFNCDGHIYFYTGGLFGGKKIYNMLKEKKIKAIRFDTYKSYEDCFLSENIQENIKQIMLCLPNP